MRSRRLTALASTAMAGIVAISILWGRAVQLDPNVKLGAAPLVGAWRWRPSPATAVPVAVAAVLCLVLPRVAGRLRFVSLVVANSIGSVVFTLTLAATDGWGRLLAPVVHPTEYWVNLATLPPAGEMLRHYGSIDFLLRYSVHAKGHPPGFLLVLKGLAALGLGHPWVAGALSYLGVAVVVVAVACTTRMVASEPIARRILPFLSVAPYAVWMGTSADAFYAAVAASGVAFTVWSAQSRSQWKALVGGLLLGSGLFLTYGMVVFLALPAVLLVGLQTTKQAFVRTVGATVVGSALVAAAFLRSGFWWMDGAQTTRSLYWAGTAQFRPWRYFLVGNLGASLIAIGPAVAVAIAGLRSRSLWWIVGGGLLGIALADASQYSKAEVERIWLLFFPWLVPAAASLRRPRIWLVAHGVTAIVLQTWLVSKW